MTNPTAHNSKSIQIVGEICCATTIFDDSKYSLWIQKAVCRFGTVVFCRLMLGFLWRVEKEKSEQKRKCKFNVEIFTQFYVKWFRLGLFQQIWGPSEYWTLLSKKPIKNNQLTSNYWTGDYQHYWKIALLLTNIALIALAVQVTIWL